MSTLYQRCLACICRRSRCRASALTGTREACRVVSVGQNWRLDCNRSLHSAAELVPGRSIDTVSFCGWAQLCRMQRSWQLLLSRCIVTPMLMRDAFLKGLILFFIFFIFFYCIAELAIKPCLSSRSIMRGEFGIPKHLQNRKQKHDKATTTPKPQTPTKTNKDTASVLEGETRGEKV